jgi:hypothetical protein
MYSPLYYRSQATIAHRLASKATNEALSEFLTQTAEDYEAIALELENRSGAAATRHPDLMPQNRR